MRPRGIKIGARSSRLAQAQATIVSNLLRKDFRGVLTMEFVPVNTLGDIMPPPSRELSRKGRAGAKGAFTQDIEALLLKGEIDIAIHSMKDLTSEPTPGLEIVSTPPRGDPRDVLISSGGETLDSLPRGARVGTSSLRRKAQLLRIRDDVEVVDFHGNIDTRIRRVIGNARAREGTDEVDAVVLAAAGIDRIGERDRVSQTFSVEEMVPAIGQGTIAVQIRERDKELAKILSRIDDPATRLESDCERAFARRLGADCNVPVGGYAKVTGESISLVGVLASDDCRELVKKKARGAAADAVGLGRRLADELLVEGRKLRGAAS